MLWSLADGRKSSYIATGRLISNARISPDGQWVAYESIESGPARVYIESFPVPGIKYEVSSAGGRQPIWNVSGSELFLVSEGKLTAVAITRSGKALQIGATRQLSRFRRTARTTWRQRPAESSLAFPPIGRSRRRSC